MALDSVGEPLGVIMVVSSSLTHPPYSQLTPSEEAFLRNYAGVVHSQMSQLPQHNIDQGKRESPTQGQVGHSLLCCFSLLYLLLQLYFFPNLHSNTTQESWGRCLAQTRNNTKRYNSNLCLLSPEHCDMSLPSLLWPGVFVVMYDQVSLVMYDQVWLVMCDEVGV